jgi:DNA polymerase III delta subunit
MDMPDLGTISNEIDKLCSYAASPTITKKDIDQIVSGTELPRIFDLADAILRQELSRALRISHALATQKKERGKNAYIGIISFLAKEIRGLLMIQAGHHPSSWSPQRLWHAKRKISSLGADRMRDLYKNILFAEQKLKSSSFSAGMLFDTLLLRATTENSGSKSATPWRKAR